MFCINIKWLATQYYGYLYTLNYAFTIIFLINGPCRYSFQHVQLSAPPAISIFHHHLFQLQYPLSGYLGIFVSLFYDIPINLGLYQSSSLSIFVQGYQSSRWDTIKHR